MRTNECWDTSLSLMGVQSTKLTHFLPFYWLTTQRLSEKREFTSCQSLAACLLGWESDHQHPLPSLCISFSLCGCLCLFIRICTWFSYSVYCILSNHQMPSEWMYEQMKTQRYSGYYLSRLTICKVSQRFQWKPEKFKVQWNHDELLPLKLWN